MAVLEKGREKALDQLQKLEDRLTQMKAKIEAKGRVNGTKVDEWKATVQKLRASSSKDETRAKEAIDQFKTCLKAIAETRVRVWCLACANTGGSPLDTTNFFEGNKINVKEGTCKSLIDKCGKVMTFFRKIRAADRIMRKFRKAATGKDKDNASSDIEENSDTDLDDDSTCMDDLETCKSNEGKRKGICHRFKLNKDDDKTWGDGKVLDNDVDNLPTDTERLLASTNSDGDANEDNTKGQDVANMEGNW